MSPAKNLKILCLNLRYLRQACNLSLRQMSRLLHIPLLTLLLLEHRIVTDRLGMDTLLRAEAVFGVPAGNLFDPLVALDIDAVSQLCYTKR